MTVANRDRQELPFGWYVVETTHRREIAAEAALLALGFDAYLPRETRWANHARQRRRVLAPLFPRYLFVHYDGASPWHALRTAKHVERIIGGGTPKPIKATWVGETRQAESEGAFDLTLAEHLVGLNDDVKIIGGPYIGYLAKVVRMEPGERVRVLFEFMRRTVEMLVPEAQLAPIDKPKAAA